jgi:PAS domain S-box-containing protein
MVRFNRLKFITTIGVIVFMAGVITLTGWQFDIQAFKSIVPGITPMNPVTAIIFIISGIWLLLQNRRKVYITLNILAGIVLVLGFIHFITYFVPCDEIRLDYLLYGDKIRNSHIFNMVAPNTALVFFLSGIAMLTTRTARRWVQRFRFGLLILGFSFAYISVIGYIFDIKPGYRFGGYTPMALYSGIAFLFLEVGLFFSNLNNRTVRTFSSSFSGGVLLRWLIPLILVFPPLTGYFRLMGEKNYLYPTEFGVELNALLYTFTVFVCMVLYASLQNKRQMNELKAKRELIVNERKFRTLFNTMKDGVICINLKGIIIYCNPGFCGMTGYSEQEMEGNNVIKMLIPDQERKEFYKRLRDLTKGNKDDYQFEILRKTGERMWIAIKSRPLLNQDGIAETFIVTVTDITEEKLKIQDLKAFTASAAHDLSSPLGRIQALAELFGTDNLDEDQKFFLTSILDTSRTMRQLLQDLLFFSKLGAVQFEKMEVNLDVIVKEICKSETPPDFKGNINIHSLPAVNGNGPAIRQLYTNLISNAIKYSSKKDNPRIEIGSYQKNGQTIYYVKDNGVGLSGDQILKLFTPFKRFHSEFEGNGMGLAIVKRIVEKHGGRIWAESVVNEGLTFHFTISPSVNSKNTPHEWHHAA